MTISSIHAFTDDVLGRHDGIAIAKLIRDREVSAREVVAAAIARAQAVEPSIGAIEADCFEQAMESASGALSGAFAGVPMFIKDMTDVAGLPTRFGSAAFHQSAPAKNTHAIAQQLLDMGMVCLGKSTMPEFGFTPSTEFADRDATRNPWNLSHSAGGSSGGSAALVAAGVIPIANAADGGGSIRIPAACCGLIGLKPSRGRLPLAQSAEPFVGVVTDGVVTRSVRDTALFMSEAERLHPNSKLAPIGHVERPLDRPLRIGAVTEPPTGVRVDDVVRREFDATLQLLASLGHQVEPLPPPVGEQFAEDFTTFWSLLALMATLTAKPIIDRSFDKTRLTEFTCALARQWRRQVHKLPGAIFRLRRSGKKYSAQFADRDAILSPTVAHLTPSIGHLGMDLPFDELFSRVSQWACFTPYANATGAPSISLPLGHDQATNLPVG